MFIKADFGMNEQIPQMTGALSSMFELYQAIYLLFFEQELQMYQRCINGTVLVGFRKR